MQNGERDHILKHEVQNITVCMREAALEVFPQPVECNVLENKILHDVIQIDSKPSYVFRSARR